MNKENRLIIKQLNKFGRVPETYELLKTIEDLEKENKELKEAIDKAIEYVENNSNIYLNIIGNKVGFFNEHNDGHVPIEILDILKEVE